MALATRCPQCGTTFRVVRDQIKLREGWVRCGVCSTPFDSHASLIEIDLPVPAPADPPVAAQAPVAAPPPAPVTPDPIEDHPAVLRTRVPRVQSGEGESIAQPVRGGWPATPVVPDVPGAPYVPNVPNVPDRLSQSGTHSTPDFGSVPDLYPSTPSSSDRTPSPDVASSKSASVPPAPFTPAVPFRADTEAASAAHLRAVLAQSDRTSPGRSEPSFGYGDVPSGNIPSASHPPAFGPAGLTDRDLDRNSDRDTEPSFRQADAPPPVNPPVSGRLDPSLRPTEPMLRAAATAAAAAAAAAGTSSRPIEPTFSSSASAPPLAESGRRHTEPTFGAAPVPRDDREPRFVTSYDDDADTDGGVDRNRGRSDDDRSGILRSSILHDDTPRDDDIDDRDRDRDHDNHPASTSYASDAATPGSPGFLSDADDASASKLRAVWIALAVVAAIVLLGQSIWLYRTELATWFPSLRPALEKACGSLDCTVGYPRDPRQLTIESSALETWAPAVSGASASGGDTGVPGTGDAAAPSAGASVGSTANATPGVRNLALRVTLRNRARHPQPWPALELSLTDFSETVVARRVLLPSTYLPPQQLADPIPAGEERSLRIPIDTTEARASGYRVAAFFP